MARAFRILIALLTVTLTVLGVAPPAQANQFALPSCSPQNAGGFDLQTAPTTTGTAGLTFSTTMILNKYTSSTIYISDSGLTSAGLAMTATDGASHIDIAISGTPTAGSFAVTITATNTSNSGGFSACYYDYTYTFTFIGAGGGGGGTGPVEPPKMQVGVPTRAGTYQVDKTITCTPTTFSITPTKVRVYFTKNGVEIPAGAGVTSYEGSSTTTAASMTLTRDYIDSTIGCVVYGESGASKGENSDSWGLLYAPTELEQVLEISDDHLRNGRGGDFVLDENKPATQDGFVGGQYIIEGRSIGHLDFTIREASKEPPTDTKGPTERDVREEVRSDREISVQVPAIQPGTYELIGRGTPTRPALVIIEIEVEKPVVPVEEAKTAAPATLEPNRYLPQAVVELIDRLRSGEEPTTSTTPTDSNGTASQTTGTANGTETGNGATTTTVPEWTSEAAVLTPTAALAALPATSDVAIQTKTLYQKFKQLFPTGIRIQFRPLSAKLTAASVKDIRKLATLPINSVAITGYVQKTKSTANDKSLSFARAQAIATVLKSAGMKASKITVRAGGVGGKTASSRAAVLNMK